MKKCLLLLTVIMLIWNWNVNISYGGDVGIKRGLEFGLYGGSLSASNGAVIIVDKNREIKTEIEEEGKTGGIRAAYNFNPYVALEVSFEPLSTNVHKVTLTDAGDEVSEEITEGEGFFYSNLTIHLLKGRVVPFVTVGGGWILFVDDTSFAYNYGGGLKIFLLDKVALRFDVREFRADYHSSITQWKLYRDEEVPFTDELTFRQITLGISFFLQ